MPVAIEPWHRYGVRFLNAAGGRAGRISERFVAARAERRVLARVFLAAWRLEQAERERTWGSVRAG